MGVPFVRFFSRGPWDRGTGSDGGQFKPRLEHDGLKGRRDTLITVGYSFYLLKSLVKHSGSLEFTLQNTGTLLSSGTVVLCQRVRFGGASPPTGSQVERRVVTGDLSGIVVSACPRTSGGSGCRSHSFDSGSGMEVTRLRTVSVLGDVAPPPHEGARN